MEVLPEELVALILQQLDAQSLTSAELVSHRWYRSANSCPVWKHVVHNEFRSRYQASCQKTVYLNDGCPKVDRAASDQDWKSLWKAKKALHQRWQDGHAAAIYLEGHTDSVYCVQFDEYAFRTRFE